MMDQYLRFGDCFIIVFSLVDQQSFEDCTHFYERVRKSKDADKIPVILVGNKKDLEEERVISGGAARILAQEFNCEYFETSAKLGQVEHVFKASVKLIEDWKQKHGVQVSEVEEEEKKKIKKKYCLTM
jgi:GTPase SAR1 family protein